VRVVDDDVLRDLAGIGADSGNAFMRELLEKFACDAHGTLERMRACARAGDASRLAREAHRLKGSSGTVGAVALAGECLEMERCARAGTCAGIEERVERALTLLEDTRGHIAEFFRGTIAAQA
jgi:histidine phosphotransfer protein HptB